VKIGLFIVDLSCTHFDAGNFERMVII